MKALKIFKRFSIILFCSLLIFVAVISTTSNKVKAVVPLAVPVLAGAVAFLGAAGITLTAPNGNGQDLANAVEEIAKDFEFNNQTLADFYNDNNAVNYIIGKDNATKIAVYSTAFTNYLNAFADYITGNYALTNSPETIFSRDLLECASGNYLMYNRTLIENQANLQTSLPVLGAGGSQTVVFNDHYSLQINEWKANNLYWGVGVTLYQDGVSISYRENRIGNYDPLDAHKMLFSYNLNNANGGVSLFFTVNNYPIWEYYIGQTVIEGTVSSSISVDGVLNEGYDDYEQALSDAQSQAGTGADARIGVNVTDVPISHPYTKENVANGILDYAADYGLTGELTGGYENDKEAEETNEGSFAPSVESVGSNIVVIDGLEDFFPFCIPFDLIALIQKFNVEPEAPVIHWNMSFAGLFQNQELVLDFNPWETAALIFRICCLIGFCIFLILKTRDMIRG